MMSRSSHDVSLDPSVLSAASLSLLLVQEAFGSPVAKCLLRLAVLHAHARQVYLDLDRDIAAHAAGLGRGPRLSTFHGCDDDATYALSFAHDALGDELGAALRWLVVLSRYSPESFDLLASDVAACAHVIDSCASSSSVPLTLYRYAAAAAREAGDAHA